MKSAVLGRPAAVLQPDHHGDADADRARFHRRAIWTAGHAIVLQLVNTNEAAQEKALGEKEEKGDDQP